MAVLNTLRTKGAVVMTGAIAFALLAFLLSDGNFLSQNPNVVVGKVNDKDVPMKDFVNKVNELTFYNQFVTNTNSLTSQQSEQINEQVWQQYVLENTFGQGVVDLGLSVGDAEMIDMAEGKYISPVLLSLFGDGRGQLNRDNLVAFVSSMDMDPSGNSKRFWKETERQIVVEREFSKLFTLVKNGMFVTEVDVNNALKTGDSTYDLSFVTATPSSDVELTDADYQSYYQSNMERFKSQPYREISYVLFESTPSDEDRAEAKKNFDELLVEFDRTKEIRQFVDLNSEDKFDERYYSETNIDPSLITFAFSKDNNITYVADGIADTHMAVRVADTKVMPDSLTLRVISVPMFMNVDSVINVIKSDSKGFDKIAQSMGIQDQPQIAPNTLSTSDIIEPKLLTAKVGDVIRMDTQESANLVYVAGASKSVKKVQLAKFIVNVVPSNKTEQETYAKANEFADLSNAKGADFKQVALDKAVVASVAKVYPENRTVGSLPDTREMVRFAFNSTKGQVSNVITVGSSNYIMKVDDVFEGGYTPLASLKESIKGVVSTEKKVANLKKELSGSSDLQAIATKYNTIVKSAEGVRFSDLFVSGMGLAPEVVGYMTTLPLNQLSAPTKTSDGVTIFMVTAKNPIDGVNSAVEKSVLENQNAVNLDQRVLSSLINNSKVEDNRILYM